MEIISKIKYTLANEEKELLILKEINPEVLDELNKLKENPLFFSQSELDEAADVFPLEFLNIKNTYEMIEGNDVIKNLKIDKKDIRRELEFEVRSKLIHLRQSFINKKTDLKELLKAVIPTLTPLIDGLLFLKKIKAPDSFQKTLTELENNYKLDVEVLRHIEQNQIPKNQIINYINQLYTFLDELANKLDKM